MINNTIKSMSTSITKKTRLIEYCPYCKNIFIIYTVLQKKSIGLVNYIIKPHEKCPKSLITLDCNGCIRNIYKFEEISLKEIQNSIII